MDNAAREVLSLEDRSKQRHGLSHLIMDCVALQEMHSPSVIEYIEIKQRESFYCLKRAEIDRIIQKEFRRKCKDPFTFLMPPDPLLYVSRNHESINANARRVQRAIEGQIERAQR